LFTARTICNSLPNLETMNQVCARITGTFKFIGCLIFTIKVLSHTSCNPVFEIIYNTRSLILYDHSREYRLRGALVNAVMKLVAQQKAGNFLTYRMAARFWKRTLQTCRHNWLVPKCSRHVTNILCHVKCRNMYPTWREWMQERL
jgi:hypothetical protein